jgi:glycosyltransferase involved in cell wall biosynthesis
VSETMTRASVCMATYQGASFVGEQIESILDQLGDYDELVVVDDASPDETLDVVSRYAADPRVRVERNPHNLGYVRTFEKALRLARGDYLFLADQDDVWLEGRLDAMLEALDRTAVVSTSVAVLGDPAPEPRYRLRQRDSRRHLANVFAVLVGYRLYTGCAMAFRRDIFDSVVPIPRFVYESHDLWLALVANTHGENTHLEEPSVARRLHGANQTPLGWRGPWAIVRARWMKARCLAVALRRRRTYVVRGPQSTLRATDQ